MQKVLLRVGEGGWGPWAPGVAPQLVHLGENLRKMHSNTGGLCLNGFKRVPSARKSVQDRGSVGLERGEGRGGRLKRLALPIQAPEQQASPRQNVSG